MKRPHRRRAPGVRRCGYGRMIRVRAITAAPGKLYEVRHWIIDALKVPQNWVNKDGDGKLILSLRGAEN